MALSVKQLNADASFLLTFEPLHNSPVAAGGSEPFRILMDPWITGPSTIFHSMFSITSRKEEACILSLQELPEPDLVIISQHKSDHCNEATLKQLPPTGTKTLILAEPAAARVIRSWKYFDKEKVWTIPRWEHPRDAGRQSVVRVKVPPIVPGGESGEVTVAYIQQRRDITGLHAAIGITYRPPPSTRTFPRGVLTPPATPKSQRSIASAQLPSPMPLSPGMNALLLAPPTPPSSPGIRSLRSIRSTASLSLHARNQAVSVIFSPHGLSYRSLGPYAASHLVAEAALPLTALLHCFNAVNNPWWLGGNISAGVPAGQETATVLGARAWISTHDADKDVKGLMTRMLKARKYAPDEIMRVLTPRLEGKDPDCDDEKTMKATRGTEVLEMKVGEEVALTSEGVWREERDERDCRISRPDREDELPRLKETIPLA